MHEVSCFFEILQGLPDQERQQLTEQLAQTEREKVSYVLCVQVVAICLLQHICMVSDTMMKCLMS